VKQITLCEQIVYELFTSYRGHVTVQNDTPDHPANGERCERSQPILMPRTVTSAISGTATREDVYAHRFSGAKLP